MSRYDIDNSGAIDKQEMLKVMKAIYAMVRLQFHREGIAVNPETAILARTEMCEIY